MAHSNGYLIFLFLSNDYIHISTTNTQSNTCNNCKNGYLKIIGRQYVKRFYYIEIIHECYFICIIEKQTKLSNCEKFSIFSLMSCQDIGN